MNTWTDEDVLTLVRLWPTKSTSQIAKELHRSRSAVCSMAGRLRIHGALPRDLPKRFEVDPRKRKLSRPARIRIVQPPKPPPPRDDSLAMRPCSILELDDGRCHWPLGEREERATLFCGHTPEPGRCYCAHHLQTSKS